MRPIHLGGASGFSENRRWLLNDNVEAVLPHSTFLSEHYLMTDTTHRNGVVALTQTINTKRRAGEADYAQKLI